MSGFGYGPLSEKQHAYLRPQGVCVEVEGGGEAGMKGCGGGGGDRPAPDNRRRINDPPKRNVGNSINDKSFMGT